MLIILQGSDRFWRWLRTISAKSTGRLRGIHSPRTKAANTPRNQDFCCLCHRPEERCVGQRQQTSQEIKNLLPLPLTRRNTFWSKAANTSRNQEFAASAVDPKKPPSVKGSKHPKKSRICCLRRRREETALGQRQQSPQEIKNLLPLPLA